MVSKSEDRVPKLSFHAFSLARLASNRFAIGLSFCMAVLFTGLYLTARHSLMTEIRHHVMGVAIATAAALNPDDLEKVKGPGDELLPIYRVLQKRLDEIVQFNPDVRYVYVMRRRLTPGAKPSDYEYVIDVSAHDRNRDGLISRDEQNEPPGTPYDGSKYPELIKSWERPGADYEIAPDPPYPDLLSGYAPIKTRLGETVAVVGVDIIASTILAHFSIIRVASILGGIIVWGLLLMMVHFYKSQRDAHIESERLSQKLARRNDLLKATVTTREKLSHMIVHDMRNLVFIISAADELMMAENNIPEQWLVNLQNIDQATNRISDFLNDLLVVAKEEKGRLTVCRCDVDLKSLAEDVVAKSDVLAQGRKVVLLAHVPETVGMVNLDVNLIRRMLDNLLSNAIKFSPVGGTVTLEVDVIHTANDLKLNSRRVRFKVFDEGPGIDEQDYDRIFEYFKTVPGFQANSPQIGLGLTLCKLVAEAHEGSILISANNPTGSIFEVDING